MYNYLQVAQDFVLDGINLAAIPLTSIKPAVNTSCVVSGWGVTESVRVNQNYLYYTKASKIITTLMYIVHVAQE